jgi:AbrB family looped-hinge helix DNA binding protein
MTTKVSDKYQVVIPKLVREQIELQEGERLQVAVVGNSIVLTPQRAWPQDYIGSLGEIWHGIDPVAYQQELRAEWR